MHFLDDSTQIWTKTSIPHASTNSEQTGMGQQESCAGLSVSQPGQEERDSDGCDVEDRTDLCLP